MGGSSFLVDGLKALLAVSGSYPVYEPNAEESFSTLARVAMGTILASQVIPRMLVSTGVALAAAASPVFSPSFKLVSALAAGLWSVHIFATALLLCTGALRPVLFHSGRAVEDLSLMLWIAAAVVLAAIGLATSSAFQRGDRAVCVS